MPKQQWGKTYSEQKVGGCASSKKNITLTRMSLSHHLLSAIQPHLSELRSPLISDYPTNTGSRSRRVALPPAAQPAAARKAKPAVPPASICGRLILVVTEVSWDGHIELGPSDSLPHIQHVFRDRLEVTRRVE